MKTRVDPTTCIGCGLCVALCPNSYTLRPGESGLVISEAAAEQPDTDELLTESIDACPVGAISHTTDHGSAQNPV